MVLSIVRTSLPLVRLISSFSALFLWLSLSLSPLGPCHSLSVSRFQTWLGLFSVACGLRAGRGQMGAGQVLVFIPVTEGVGVARTGKRSSWLCPCHSQCPLLLLAVTRCCDWQLGQWSQEHLGQACNPRRPPRSVGSQLWLRPLLLGLLLWLSGLTFAWDTGVRAGALWLPRIPYPRLGRERAGV